MSGCRVKPDFYPGDKKLDPKMQLPPTLQRDRQGDPQFYIPTITTTPAGVFIV
jgi:hypothetical protein